MVPGGKPASFISSIINIGAPGSRSDGFSTIVLPQIRDTGNICTDNILFFCTYSPTNIQYSLVTAVLQPPGHNTVEQSARTASATGHHLRTVQTIVENVCLVSWAAALCI